MTVMDLIERCSARLSQAGVSFGHGTTNAFDEAAWLVLWRLGLPLDALDEVAERAVSAAEHAAVDALTDQRISTRQPAAYLTGEAWLQGVPFTVDARAIVPRSLIAEPLADGTLDTWLKPHTQRVLDLCTGNGSLAVLAALAWPDVVVDAADLSPDALAVAQLNITRHALAGRISLHAGDGLAAVPNQCYDLILCNPPYVNSAAMAALPAEYRAEPTWPWPVAMTAWISSATCCVPPRPTWHPTRCWCWKSAMSATTLSTPSPCWMWCGCPPAPAMTRCCC